MAADLRSAAHLGENHTAFPVRIVALLVAGALGCSARDLSPLHNGVRSSGGTAGFTASAGGTGGSGGGGGTAGTPGGTGGMRTEIDLGPWTFDSEQEVSSGDWVAYTGRTTLTWIAEGEAPILGSLVVDGSTARNREIIHVLDPTPAASEPGRAVDMSTYTLNIVARTAVDMTTLQLFATDTAFTRASGEITTLGTEWTTLSFPLNTPDPTSPTHDPARTMSLGVITGPSPVWIDRLWLVNDASSQGP
ncbi:MAG: hypothetical protein ACOY0T_27795 [Myxococcota bacterium]